MAMRGIVIYCANNDCRKPVLRDAYLRVGSRCSIRCFACGMATDIESTPTGITRRVIIIAKPLTNIPERPTMKTDEQDSFFAVET